MIKEQTKKYGIKYRMKKGLSFIKKEAVLCAALVLAVISACIIPPDGEYGGYIDYRTLAILFCLMCVMAGMQKIGVFRWTAHRLLGRVRSIGALVQVLMLLCFFSSMLITNDVALITFVPFTFTVLGMMDGEQRRKLALPLVAMQTMAANLGSMLTPIGNPQNLYLYGRAGMSMGSFLLLMLPYAAFSLGLLLVWGLILGRRCSGEWKSGGEEEQGRKENSSGADSLLVPLGVYLALFLLCLLTVAHILPWQGVLGIVLAAVLILDRSVLKKVDYSLLLTFVGFFIFIGNVGRIPAFRSFLQGAVEGREVFAAIAASQVISNVPAALLLAGFTENYSQLIIGVNLGGLGTLIASMASLISYKYVAKEESSRKGAYIGVFTVGSICLLALLLGFHLAVGSLWSI